MKRTYIILCILLVAVIAAYLCLRPWPEQHELTFYGAALGDDGEITAEGTITIQAVRNRYLFKSDDYESLAITAPGCQTDSDNVDTNLPIMTAPGMPYEHTTFIDLFGSRHGAVWVNIGLELDWCWIKVNDQVFVGSVNENFDPKVILEQCGN